MTFMKPFYPSAIAMALQISPFLGCYFAKISLVYTVKNVSFFYTFIIVDGSDSESSSTLKNILNDLLSNNTDEKIKIMLWQQDNA